MSKKTTQRPLRLTEHLSERWTDPETGLQCMIRRVKMMHLCGYVKVPDTHPWWGKSYNDEVTAAGNCIADLIDVHGSLTFGAAIIEPGGDVGWWFGFDCAHAGDLVPCVGDPGLESVLRTFGMLGDSEGVDRDWEYVKAQLLSTAKQLAAVQS